MQKDDGGPAFPSDSVNKQFPTNEGMSLRDWFAGQALAGIAANESYSEKQTAEFCFQIADLMIEVRKKDAKD
jgi:hypothetical protein